MQKTISKETNKKNMWTQNPDKSFTPGRVGQLGAFDEGKKNTEKRTVSGRSASRVFTSDAFFRVAACRCRFTSLLGISGGSHLYLMVILTSPVSTRDIATHIASRKKLGLGLLAEHTRET